MQRIAGKPSPLQRRLLQKEEDEQGQGAQRRRGPGVAAPDEQHEQDQDERAQDAERDPSRTQAAKAPDHAAAGDQRDQKQAADHPEQGIERRIEIETVLDEDGEEAGRGQHGADDPSKAAFLLVAGGLQQALILGIAQQEVLIRHFDDLPEAITAYPPAAISAQERVVIQGGVAVGQGKGVSAVQTIGTQTDRLRRASAVEHEVSPYPADHPPLLGALHQMADKPVIFLHRAGKQFDTVIHLVHLLIVMDDVDAVIDHLLHALDLLQHHLHSFFCDLIPLPPSFHPGLFDELFIFEFA